MVFDFAIVGGGIVGLATARALCERFPDKRLVLIEKEAALGMHQTGHNSGVIHSGLYYRPGSEKARLCAEGARAMFAFCEAEAIPFERSGKLVIATSEGELGRLAELERRGLANGLMGIRRLGPEELRAHEPRASGIAALHVPLTGIVDFGRVAARLGERLAESGATVFRRARVERIERRADEWILQAGEREVFARFLVGCAGLMSDRLAALAGAPPSLRIVPFRGEYYALKPERRDLVRGLIYPVPDPAFPFLGVHFTRRIDGGVEAGPNAVLAFKREGYRKRDVSLRDLAELITYPGFRRMVGRYWRTGLGEMWRSFSKRAFVRALARLLPDITTQDLERGGAGVRAQAVLPDGTLADDFQFLDQPHALHVLNAPSPAATASLAIGRAIAERIATSMG